MNPLSQELKREILRADSCFIPILFKKKQQVYMVHLQAKALKVVVYTSDKYNDDQDSSDQNNKEFNSMQSEGAIPGSMLSPARESQRKQPESII